MKTDFSKSKNITSLPVPEKVQALHWDTNQPHLGLAISPKGKRSWIIDRRVNGRSVRRVLGEFPRIDYRAALREFRIVDSELEQGIDHVTERKQRAAAEASTFGAVLTAYVNGKQRAKDALPLKPRTVRDYLAMIEPARTLVNGRTTLPGPLFALKDIPVNDITAQDIRDCHAAIQGDRRQTYAMQVARAVLNWQGVTIEGNPLGKEVAGKDRIMLKPSTVKPTPIRPEHLGAWWKAATDMNTPAADYLRLRLLTGTRGVEILGDAWNAPLTVGDCDLIGGRLTLRDTKNRTTFTVMLSDMALEIVRKAAAGRSASEALFPLTDARKTLMAVNVAAGLPAMAHTGHDLRHTFASVAEELVSYSTLKAMMNHIGGGDVTQGYVGKSEAQLRKGWQAVADHVREVSGSV